MVLPVFLQSSFCGVMTNKAVFVFNGSLTYCGSLNLVACLGRANAAY
jgi:hypothetical protein